MIGNQKTVVRTFTITTETDQRIQSLGNVEMRRWAGVIIDRAVAELWLKEHPESKLLVPPATTLEGESTLQ